MTNKKPETHYIAIDELHLLEENPRKIDEEDFDRLCKSIEKNPDFFWARPCLANDSSGKNIVYAGNQRLKAARHLGLTEVPVIIETLTVEQEKERTIRDNVANGQWDFELLDEHYDKDDLYEWGIEIGKREILGAGGGGDSSAVPDLEKVAISQKGDLYELGDHRLVCGDSTMLADVQRAVGTEKVSCLWTDPPYNVNYEGSDGQKIQNDDMKNDDFRQLLLDSFVSAYACMKPGAAAYIAHADTEGLNFRGAFRDAGFKLSGCLIWVKPSLVLGRSDYQWRHEPILYGWRADGAHFWDGERDKTTVFDVAQDRGWDVDEDGSVSILDGDKILKISGKDLQVNEVPATTIYKDKPAKNDDHPTMKPTELIAEMLFNSTKRGDLVLDLFAGSGSTMIACEQTARKSALVELDEKYCDVIVRRWMDFTGQNEFVLNGTKMTREEWES